MKLHLPKMLTAALLAAFATAGFTLPQAQASTEYNGVAYSGYIFNVMDTGTHLYHNATFSNYYWNDGEWVNSQSWVGTDSTYYTGTVSHTLTGSNNSFWRRLFGDANSGDANLLGNTIRLASATGNTYYESQFGPYQIGGIIAEAGNNGMYVLGRTGGGCEMKLKAQAGADFNMYVASNLGLSSNTSITVYNGGTWNVLEGKTLTLAKYTSTGDLGAIANTPSITFAEGVAVTMTGGGTIDMTRTNVLNVNSGASIKVGADTTVLFAAATTLGGTITNAGTVTFTSDTVNLTSDLSGFAHEGTYTDYNGETAQDGFAGKMVYTIIDGAGSTNLAKVNYGGKSGVALESGKLTVDEGTVYTTYHINTNAADLDLAKAAALADGALTTVSVHGANATIAVGSTQTLSTLSVASGADATISGQGALTLTTLNNSGSVYIATDVTMATPQTFTASDAPAIHVVEGGVYRISASSSNIGAADATTERTNTAFTQLFQGKFVDVQQGGKLVLQGGVKTCNTSISGGPVTIESGVADMEITGTLSINTWATSGGGTTWKLGTHSLTVGEDLWMTNHQTLSVAGGSVTAGRLLIGHSSNNADGSVPGAFTATDGSVVTLGGIGLYGGHNTVSITGSELTFNAAAADTNLLAKMGDKANTDSTITLVDTTLNSGSNGWTLAPIDGVTVTISGTSTVNVAAGKAVTLSANSIAGTFAKDGEGALTLVGTTAGTVLGQAINLSAGTLTMTGSFNIDALEVSGEETTWERAEGIAEGSGFKKVSGTVTVVSIEDGTLNAAGATLIREGDTVQLADTGVVTLSGTANYTTLWVNNIGAVSYDVAQTLAGEINVGTVRLEAEGATVTMDKADAAVDIVVADGVNAGVKATQDTTINSITGLSADKAITISGEGTVSLSQDPAITASNVAVNGGHLELGGARHMINLSVTNGTASTTHHGNNPCISGTLTINEGGVFTVAGEGQDAFGYTGGDTSNMDIYLAGKDGNHAELALNQQTTDTVTMSANLHFGGYADVTSTTTGFNTFGGQISVTGVDNTITNMQLRKAVTVTVAAEGVLTINNMTRFSGFNDGLTKEGAGKLVFGGTNVLDKTIQVNAGSLELNGTYSIGGIADVDSYEYNGGEQEGNGFLTTTHTKNLYALAQGASGSIGEGAVFKIGETDVTDKVENGAYSTSSTDDSVFYVNTGTEKVSKARTSQNLVGIMMLGDNTTLTVDDNLASSEVEAYGTNVTLNIGSGYTVAGQVSGFVLDGTGTYVISGLNNVNASLGTGVTLADSWAGTVKFSGCTTLMNINLNNLGKNGSAVEFDGVTGYFEAPNPGIDFTNKLVLSGSGLEIVNGSTTRTYTFSGGVAGDGDFIYSMRSGASDQTYVFNADVKDWTGAFKSTDARKTGKLQFMGNATEVGAAIVLDAGTLTVEVGNGSDAFTTTFDQAVGATTLNVKSSAEATVKGALDVTTANVAGGLTVAGVDSNIATLNLTGDFAVAEGGSVTLGTVAVTGTETTMSGAGTAVLTSAIALNEGSLTMSGVYNIDAFEYQGESTIEGGVHAGNGYATEKGTITVVTLADETTLSATGASIVRGGNTFSLADDGTAALNSTNYAAFYITNLSETVTQAKSKEEESGVALASIHVATGAALDVDQSINLSLVSAETGAKLNILSGQTVSVGDATTVATIAGEGTYALKSGSNTMTGTLAEGSDWTGTVRLSDVSINNINLNNYGHEGSKVAMDGVSGYFLQAQAVFAPELVLEGAGLTLNNGFSTMPSGNPRPPTTYTFAGGVSGEGDMTFNRPVVPGASTITQHLYFTGDVKNWTGSLNVVSLFNVYAQYSGADQKVNSTISRTGGELHVEVGTGSDASVVTFSKAITADDLTVKAGATAIINGGLSTNTITVGDNATLVINGNTTLTSAITSTGTVSLTNVALSDAFTAKEGGITEHYVDETLNYYLGTAYEYLDVVTGTGAANATGTGLSWGGQDSLTMTAGQVKVSDHGTASYDTLYIGQDTTTAQIAAYDRIDDLTDIVVENGKLTVTAGDIQQPVNISVSVNGTIAGDVDPTQVGIGAGATAEFTAPVEPLEGIRFTAAPEGTVKVTNDGETATKYNMESGATLNKDLLVEAQKLEVLQAEMYIVNNALDVEEIIIEQPGTSLTLGNAESLQLTNLHLAEGSTLALSYKDEEQVVQEGTVTITDALVAGGGTLYANLTLVGHELGDETPNLLYWDLNGAGENALTLGSTLTLDTETGLIQLDNDTMQAIAALETRGDYLELVVDAGTGLEYIGDGWFDGVFSRTYTNAGGELTQLGGDYNVQLLENGNFGIVKFSNVPEPTTGTLSLLALMALAARRRRH